MRFAYVRYIAGETSIQLSFELNGASRHFNRKISEKLEKLIDRIQVIVSPNHCKKWKTPSKKNIKLASLDVYRKNILPVVNFINENEETFQTNEKLYPILTQTKKIIIDKDEYRVFFNHPKVSKLSLILPLLCGYPALPQGEVEFTDLAKCCWRWYRREQDGDVQVGENQMYIPTNDDIDKQLLVKCGPSPECLHDQLVSTSFQTCLVNASPTQDGLMERYEIGRNGPISKDSKQFRICSYNILHDSYATSKFAQKEMFPYCNIKYLKEGYRMQLVLKEVLNYESDIIAFQEIGERVFNNYFVPLLSKFGYSGVYNGKTKTVSEGGAVFFRKNVFEIQNQISIKLGGIFETTDDVQNILDQFPQIKECLKDLPTIGQMVFLKQIKPPYRPLVVVNNHLYFRDDANFVRLLQTAILLRKIEEIQKQSIHEERSALILCGDLNSSPETCTMQFLLNGMVDHTHDDWRNASFFQWNKECENKNLCNHNPYVIAPVIHLENSLPLKSGCGFPKYTSFTSGFKATIDYILVDKVNLEVTSLFPEVKTNFLIEHEALPSVNFPSDHIAQVCDIMWKS